MTQDFPIEGTNLGIYEGCFAKVEKRKKYENLKKTTLFDSWEINERQDYEHRL